MTWSGAGRQDPEPFAAPGGWPARPPAQLDPTDPDCLGLLGHPGLALVDPLLFQRRTLALAAAGSRREVSLDQPVGNEGDGSLGDLVAATPAREEPEDLLVLPGMVAALPTLEREVIMLRFFQELDQHEIAARVGYSQMHISRLQRRALARMRAQLVEP